MTKTMLNDDSADWEEFLDEFPAQWLCTLKVRPDVTRPEARQRLNTWLRELGEGLGTEDFDWVVAPGLGTIGIDFHFHLLVGGLKKWFAAERLFWMRRWFEMAGEARIDEYKSRSGRVHYIFKTIEGDELKDHDCPLCSQLL
jgi:hypothetical protein